MKNLHTIDEIVEDGAKMVRFRINNGWDYVWITYHDVKGFITITSSYGNFSYIWSSMGKNVILREFFSRANKEYLSDKFISDVHEKRETFDFDLAIRELKIELLKDRRKHILDKYEAREIFNDIKDFADNDSDMSNERFYNLFFDYDNLNKWKQEPWCSNYGIRPTGTYLILQNEIIPMIQDYFKKTLEME